MIRNTLIKIVRRLDVSLDYIVFGTNEPKKPDSAEKINAILDGADAGKLIYAAEIFTKIAKVSAE